MQIAAPRGLDPGPVQIAALPCLPLFYSGTRRDQRRKAVGEACDRDALLLRGVALADRHRAIAQRLEVDGDAERGADLVLTAVTLPDAAAGLVVLDPELTLQR